VRGRTFGLDVRKFRLSCPLACARFPTLCELVHFRFGISTGTHPPHTKPLIFKRETRACAQARVRWRARMTRARDARLRARVVMRARARAVMRDIPRAGEAGATYRAQARQRHASR
jgi:hypothetical protein